MNVRYLFSLIVALLSVLPIRAAQRTEQAMHTIACNVLCGQTATRSSIAPDDVRLAVMTSAYSIYDSTEGFVVVGRDSASPAVLGRSFTPYDAASLPPAFLWWLEATRLSLSASAATRSFTAGASYTPVEKFITSQWGQYAPFNAKCLTSDGQQCVTGCLATALAQILYYYKYPSGYNWSSMSDFYYGTESNYDVAQLAYDCAYACKTSFYIDEGYPQGTAFDFDGAKALVNTFNFSDSNIQYLTRFYYSDSDWMRIVYEELASRRPILYGGEGTGGHAFLLCGVDGAGSVYVNWGWYGTCDGWYDISYLNPTSSTYDFNSNQSMIVGIAPSSTNVTLRPRYSELCYVYSPDNELDGSPYTFTSTEANILSVADNQRRMIVNFHYLNFSGSVYLVFTDASNQRYTIEFIKVNSSSETWTLRSYDIYKSLDITKLPAGSYTAMLATRDSRDSDFCPVRALGGVPYFSLNKYSDGTLIVGSPQIKAEKNLFSSDIMTDVSRVIRVTSAAADTDTRPATYSYDLSGKRLNDESCRQGLVIKDGRKYTSR